MKLHVYNWYHCSYFLMVKNCYDKVLSQILWGTSLCPQQLDLHHPICVEQDLVVMDGARGQTQSTAHNAIPDFTVSTYHRSVAYNAILRMSTGYCITGMLILL
jgi:hypothetical protein